MKISNIKRIAYENMLNQEFDSYIDRIISTCLLYDYLYSLVSSDNSYESKVKQVAKSYSKLYKGTVAKLKSTYISYVIMKKKIISFGKDSFLELSVDQIQTIVDLYKDKTKIVSFSIGTFSQYMYKISKMDYVFFQRLSKIHKDVMSPIMKHYIDSNSLKETDLEVYDAEVNPDAPGKIILFTINGVPSSRVASDISSRRIYIDYKSISVQGNYVKITTK